MCILKVNFITEAELVRLKTTGIVVAYKNLKEVLEKNGIEVDVNGKGKEYDIVHVHSFGPYSFLRLKNFQGPKIITAHTLPQEMGMLFRGMKYFDGFFKTYFRSFYNNADLIFAPSEFVLSELQRMGVNKPAVVLSNGIDIKRFKFDRKKRKKFRRKYFLKNNEPVIYSVGLLSYRKGLDIFLKVAQLMKEYKFVWVGPVMYGKLQADYNKIIKILQSPPSNVIFTGYYRGDITDVHCGCDIFFFPSKIETQGIVVLEAMCCKKPIVLKDIETYLSLKDGYDCMKIKSESEAKEKITQLINDSSLRKKVIKNGYKKALENDINIIAKKVIKIYEETII